MHDHDARHGDKILGYISRRFTEGDAVQTQS